MYQIVEIKANGFCKFVDDFASFSYNDLIRLYDEVSKHWPHMNWE